MAAFEGSEGLGIEGLAPCQRVTLFFAESFGMAGHGRVSWLDVQFHWFFPPVSATFAHALSD